MVAGGSSARLKLARNSLRGDENASKFRRTVTSHNRIRIYALPRKLAELSKAEAAIGDHGVNPIANPFFANLLF